MGGLEMSFWKGKKVLVTGADGFIGSWVAKTLVEKGANVVTIVRDIKKENCLDIWNMRQKITVVHGDLVDIAVVQRTLNEFEIDTVFHLAAQALVGSANKSPLSTFESNIKGTWNILEACRLLGSVKRIVMASSDKAYGQQKKLPYTEDSPLLGYYPYDASKACADILSTSYFKTYGLPIAITRNANTYGPGDLNYSRIVPDVVSSVLRGDVPVIRSDGTLQRDYMYIKDAVNAYLALAENMDRKEIVGQAFNFGAETPISVLELFRKIIRMMGKKIEPKVLGQARHEIDRQYLACDKARKLLKWKPEHTLDEGLKETIEWYTSYLGKSR